MANGSQDGDTISGAQAGGLGWRRKAATHYREYAGQLHDLAEGEPDTALRGRLMALAEEYDGLAERLDPRR